MATLNDKLKSYSTKQLQAIVAKNAGDERYNVAVSILVKRNVIEEPKVEEPKVEESATLDVLKNIQQTWREKKGTEVAFEPNANCKTKETSLVGKIVGANIDKRKMVIFVRINVDGKIYHKVTNALMLIK